MNIRTLRSFCEIFLEQTVAAHGSQRSLTLLHFDVERLGAINRRFGRGVGDSVLEAVGQVLESACADDEPCVRFSGDEWLIVLPGADLKNALRRGRHLLARVAALPWSELDEAHRPRCRLRLLVEHPRAAWQALGRVDEWPRLDDLENDRRGPTLAAVEFTSGARLASL